MSENKLRSPLEMDPMEDMLRQSDAAREAALKMLENTEKEFAEVSADLAEKEKELAKTKSENDCLTVRLKNAKVEINNQKCEIAALRKELRKPIWKPLCILAALIVLAGLVALAVEKCLVVPMLGEPLGYGVVCVAAIFGGVIWERSSRRV